MSAAGRSRAASSRAAYFILKMFLKRFLKLMWNGIARPRRGCWRPGGAPGGRSAGAAAARGTRDRSLNLQQATTPVSHLTSQLARLSSSTRSACSNKQAWFILIVPGGMFHIHLTIGLR